MNVLRHAHERERPMTSSDGASTAWGAIYAQLRAAIDDGTLRTGDRLPTEAALAQQHRVNRHTVRRAMAALTAEGAIWVRRGSGAYVAAGRLDYPLGDKVKFTRTIRAIGRKPLRRVLDADTRPPGETVARRLRLRQGRSVVRIAMLSLVDDLPIAHVEHFFPEHRFAGLDAAVRETLSVTAALARYGVADYVRAWTRIAAIRPSRDIAALLGQPEIEPVLRAEALNRDMTGEPIEYAVSQWAATRTQFVVGGGADIGGPS
jgi:GntR family phosphonate transport system transcriptional regulator